MRKRPQKMSTWRKIGIAFIVFLVLGAISGFFERIGSHPARRPSGADQGGALTMTEPRRRLAR